MSGIQIRQAKREKIYAKIALMGASGSGKSYSALRIAKGMLSKLKELGLEQNGRIAVINTEQGRGLYYANEFGGSTNEELMGVMYKYAESGNPNDIKSVDELNALYAELSQYKKQ